MKRLFNLQPTTYNQQLKFGFTLIELLVAISIIAILISLGVTSYSTAQTKSRDSKRKSDMKELQNALEQYYSVCGYIYPTVNSGTFYAGGINCPTPAISIMPTLVSDLRGTTPYYCGTGSTPNQSDCNSSSYSVCAMLESETPNYFCVTNKQ